MSSSATDGRGRDADREQLPGTYCADPTNMPGPHCCKRTIGWCENYDPTVDSSL